MTQLPAMTVVANRSGKPLGVVVKSRKHSGTVIFFDAYAASQCSIGSVYWDDVRQFTGTLPEHAARVLPGIRPLKRQTRRHSPSLYD